MKYLAIIAALCAAPLAHAEVKIAPPAEGSVTTAQGLEAWARIYEVTSHPRCSNCHVGASERPMWSGPSYDRTRRHGMNIRAGESRIGAEHILCSTCHVTNLGTVAQTGPHMAPQVPGDWRLAPEGADWFGRSSDQICAQLSNPDRTGGLDYLDLAGHAGHDAVLQWAWNPGGEREAAPYSLQEHINDILIWGVAGKPCPTS